MAAVELLEDRILLSATQAEATWFPASDMLLVEGPSGGDSGYDGDVNIVVTAAGGQVNVSYNGIPIAIDNAAGGLAAASVEYIHVSLNNGNFALIEGKVDLRGVTADAGFTGIVPQNAGTPNEEPGVSIRGSYSSFEEYYGSPDYANYIRGWSALLANIHGGSKGDVLEGSIDNDEIWGYEGDDTINVSGGGETPTLWSNIVHGGDGNDTITGGVRPDELWGGAGDDTIEGGGENDTIWGEAGEDDIEGGAGEDEIHGGDDDDTIDGGGENDMIWGDAGEDEIEGGAGEDEIRGGDDLDFILGGNDDDELHGGPGHDLIFGDAGDDWIKGNDGADNINGGSGDDEVRGDLGNDIIDGMDGNDILYGGEGNDQIEGAGGADTIDGGAGADTLNGDADNDTILAGDGWDILSGGDGIDNLSGGDGSDWLWSGDGAPSGLQETLDGGPDCDFIDGIAECDVLTASIMADWDAAESVASNGQFTVWLSQIASSDITVTYTVSGTATAGADYSTLSGSVIIPQGSDYATITIAPIDDSDVEGDESVVITLQPGTNYTVVPDVDDEATLSIFDDDIYRTASIAVDWDAAESIASYGQFTIWLSEAADSNLTVSYTVGGAATGGTDYASLSGSVTIPQGSDYATITIASVDDALVEGNEDVVITLQPGTGYTTNPDVDDEATLSIFDDDINRTASITFDWDATEDIASTGQFTVWLSEAADSNLAVSYTVGGSATAGVDYATLSGSVVVPLGEYSATITVSPIDDTLVEGGEDVVITLQPGTGYQINPGVDDSAFISIFDNDSPGLRAAAPPPADASAGDSASASDLRSLADAAIVYWALAGTRPESLAALRDVSFVVTDLPGLMLAEVSGTTVFVDENAAGYGWFIDATPWDSTEFDRMPGTSEFAASGGPAAGRMDLLTVLVHELGHLLDVPHADPRLSPHDVMLPTLPAGTRRLPPAALDVQDVPQEQWKQIERVFAWSIWDADPTDTH